MCVALFFSTIAIPFVLYTVEDTIIAWNNIGWIGHIILVVGFIIGYLGQKKKQFEKKIEAFLLIE